MMLKIEIDSRLHETLKRWAGRLAGETGGTLLVCIYGDDKHGGQQIINEYLSAAVLATVLTMEDHDA